jgi:hypothetical protein
MNNISIFVKKEFILLMLISIVFINPFFYGYRLAMLFFIFIFLKINYFLPSIDKNVFYLFFFAFSYELLASLKLGYVDNGLVSILPNIFVPSLLYLVGKYISVNYKNHEIWIFILFYLTIVFSIIPMISILLQIREHGFIEGTRSMYLIWDKNAELSATGLGSYFVLNMASIGLISIKKNTKLERIIAVGLIISFALSLVCVLRLGNRTQLVIAIVSLVGSFVLNIRKQSLFKNVIFVVSIITLIYYLITTINENSQVMKFYSDRINNDEAGIGTAGGRTERWIGSLESIATDPFGWEITRYGYAHNLWLDVARISGVIPLLFLVFFTISSFKTWMRTLGILKNSLVIRSYIFIFFIGIILVFIVEPIMEGMYLLFLLFCLFVGFLNGIRKK